MNIKKRLEKLETAEKIQVAKFAVTEIILVPGGAITGGSARWCNTSSGFVAVTEEELSEIQSRYCVNKSG